MDLYTKYEVSILNGCGDIFDEKVLRNYGRTDGTTDRCKPVYPPLFQSGGIKRGRQKKRWEDNIKKWAGMDFASSNRAAENRSRWIGLLRIHLWCPDDLPRLWDRIATELFKKSLLQERKQAVKKSLSFVKLERIRNIMMSVVLIHFQSS